LFGILRKNLNFYSGDKLFGSIPVRKSPQYIGGLDVKISFNFKKLREKSLDDNENSRMTQLYKI